MAKHHYEINFFILQFELSISAVNRFLHYSYIPEENSPVPTCVHNVTSAEHMKKELCNLNTKKTLININK